MQYKGTIKDGVVVLEAGTPLEDGTEVLVQPVASDKSAGEPTIWEKLQKFSGTVKDLPRDMARNHDHYIHGGPKK
jgi:hypothetical protein